MEIDFDYDHTVLQLFCSLDQYMSNQRSTVMASIRELTTERVRLTPAAVATNPSDLAVYAILT